MRLKITLILSLFITLLFVGCSSTSTLSKQTDKAGTAFSAGDFETAFNLYDTFIRDQESKDKEVNGAIYGAAAKAALQLNKFIEAEKYYKMAFYKKSGDADLYAQMSEVYKKMDNLSKELDALAFFNDHFSNDPRHNTLKKRLFELYVESENWGKAADLWPSFDLDNQAELHLMELYLVVQKVLDKKETADKYAGLILKKDVTNRNALEWNAEKYFWKAENTYQAALDAYEKNKTNKQYTIMLKTLDRVTLDFKRALKYYQMLYKLYPSKTYAKYIANVYMRFQDKKNADYYLNLAK
ncbi:MAG: hypothetical protein JW857_01685 [Bacteroidales bacterium]|nr:hypothetical protein [Bacteroidales bacterium]